MHKHVEIPGHDFVDRVEWRPHRGPIAQSIEELDGKSAQISTVVQALLTLREFSDNPIAILLEVFIAGARVHERDRREIVAAGEVAAEFAVGGFPSAKWLRGSRQPSVDAKGMQQPIRRERLEVTAIGFHGRRGGAFPQADLLHWEWTNVPGDFLAIDRLAVRISAVYHWILRDGDFREQSRSSRCADACNEVSAGKFREWNHALLLGLPINAFLQ